MERRLIRLVAGIMVFLMVVSNMLSAVPAYAKSSIENVPENANITESVLKLTQSMIPTDGRFYLEGNWDYIVIPRDIKATRIIFRNVEVGTVEIESGNTCKIDMVSGLIGDVKIVPAETYQMTIQEIKRLYEEFGDATKVISLYQQWQEQNNRYLENRPIITTKKDVDISNISIAGNAKVNLKNGNVENVVVEADEAQRELRVNISDYDGNLVVKQKNSDDKKWNIARVELKNSKVDNLVIEGEGRGNIVLEGNSTEINDVKVECASMITMGVSAQMIEIKEDAKEATLIVLDDVEEIHISADGAIVEIGNCGNVNKADIEGNNVNISGSGTLVDAEIKGDMVSVSTDGTNVEGTNVYVPIIPAEELSITITEAGFHENYYKEYPDPENPDTTCFVEFGKGISGKYAYSRKLTQEEQDNWGHGGNLYDEEGNRMVSGIGFVCWSSREGDFAIQFLPGLKAGSYELELFHVINGKYTATRYPFTLEEDIPEEELGITITEAGFHENYYKEYPDPENPDTTCFVEFGKGISGKYAYSRKLTQEEQDNWGHGGNLYDEEGNRMVSGIGFVCWSSREGDFAIQFLPGLKAGSYELELFHVINGKYIATRYPFTLEEDIPEEELSITITEAGIHESYYKEYPDPDRPDTTCLIDLGKGISGKFSYSRELTQEELENWRHGGELYDEEGNWMELNGESSFRHWALSDGTFAMQLPSGLKAGNYVYELHLVVDEKVITASYPFTLEEDIPKEELSITITEAGIHESYYKEYPDPDRPDTTCLIDLGKGISGKFVYSRELTQEELADLGHDGHLYNEEGEQLFFGNESGYSIWAHSTSLEGDFAVQFPLELETGDYVYELLLITGEKVLIAKYPFHIDEDYLE